MRMIAIVDDLANDPTRVQRQIIFFDAQAYPEARDTVHAILKQKFEKKNFSVTFSIITFQGIQLST